MHSYQAGPAPQEKLPTTGDSLRVRGWATLYRLFDVGYEIRLDETLALVAEQAPERVRPVRGEAQAIHIPNPPITLSLGNERLVVDGHRYDVDVSARIFDFGVVSLHLRVLAPNDVTWEEFTDFGNRVDASAETDKVLHAHLDQLVDRIAPAVNRLGVAQISEDYVVYRISSLRDGRGQPVVPAEALRDSDIVPLLLNERRTLSADARRELLPHRFSYYADDLAILTWDNALIVDPSPDEETDLQYVLEFANAQLLELRFYDALLDAELPRMYDRIDAARGGIRPFLNRRLRMLLARLQKTVADSTEIVERVENSFKVTDDVYLARVYSAALEIFRGRAWRTGIDRKLSIVRETYGMLNGEAQAARSEALEIAIVVLIVAEIILAFFR